MVVSNIFFSETLILYFYFQGCDELCIFMGGHSAVPLSAARAAGTTRAEESSNLADRAPPGTASPGARGRGWEGDPLRRTSARSAADTTPVKTTTIANRQLSGESSDLHHDVFDQPVIAVETPQRTVLEIFQRLSSQYTRVCTNLENLEKSGKFLFQEKSGKFVQLDQKSEFFSKQ